MNSKEIEELLIIELIKPEHFERTEVKVIRLDDLDNENYLSLVRFRLNDNEFFEQIYSFDLEDGLIKNLLEKLGTPIRYSLGGSGSNIGKSSTKTYEEFKQKRVGE